MIHPSRYFFFVAFALLPHFLILPVDVTAIVVFLLSWSAIYCYKNILHPAIWTLRALTASTVVFCVLRYGSLANPDAATALLCMITTLKLFETQSYRDAMALLLMILIVVMSYLIHSFSLPTTFYMLINFIIYVYFVMELQRKKYFLKQNSVQWKDFFSMEMVVALPLLVGLFVFFPRFTTRFGAGERVVQTIGFSDQIQLGDLIQLSQSSEVAFKVRFLKSQKVDYNDLYFRGAVLTNNQRMVWKKSSAAVDYLQNLNTTTAPDYRVLLVPRQQKNLFTLANTSLYKLTPHVILFTKKGENIFYTSSPIEQNISYYASIDKTPTTQRYTQEELTIDFTPDDSFKSILKNMDALTTEQKVENILTYFKTNNFSYSTEVPGYKNINEFLSTKSGFCEHYASAFVTLSRSLGIPSRIVVGFMGGEFNPYDDSLTVRDKFAHAWAEVFSEKKGWYRVDPTSVIYPDRLIGASLASAQSGKFYENFFTNSSLFLESINNKFELFLMNFNSDSQIGTVARWSQYFQMQSIVFFLGILLFFIILTSIIWWLWRFEFRKVDPLTIAVELLIKKMSLKDSRKLTYEGPLEFYQRLSKNTSLPKEHLALLNNYIVLRFSEPSDYKKNKDFYLKVKKLPRV